MTWSEKIMLHITRSVWSSWTHICCFHCSSWSLSKVIAEKPLVTFHDLKWPWRHTEGSLIAMFRLRVSWIPVTRCLRVFRMVFFQKRRLSFCSHWHWLRIERSKNSDLVSWIPKFRDKHFIDTGTDINWSNFQGDRPFGVAMTITQTFLRWGHLTWPGDLTLSDLGLKS